MPLAGGPGGNYGHIPSVGVGGGPAGSTGAGAPPSYPLAAPAYGGFGGPPPSAPKKSRLWVWVTLAVVLVLGSGTGITLAVVKPWSDDGSSSTEGGDGEKGKKEKTTAAVQGDLNGDGLGDAAYYIYYSYDKVTKVTAISDGEKFETSELAVEPRTEPQRTHFDWDGDGTNEELATTYVGSANQLSLSSDDDDWPDDQTVSFSFASLQEYGDPEIELTHGDFDGDGDEDLVVAGQNNKTVDLYVLANDGDGSFAEPSLWVSVPNAVIGAVKLYAGDFDKDGDDDIWTQLPSERLENKDYKRSFYGDRGYALLTSDGKAFTLGAVTKPDGYFRFLNVADVTGDGTDSIIAVESSSYDEEVRVSVFDVSGGSMSEVTGFTGTTKVGDRDLQSAELSDVDGDGKADLVFTAKNYDQKKFTGIQVMRSTGAVFEAGTEWAPTPTCPDDDCRIYFEGTSLY